MNTANPIWQFSLNYLHAVLWLGSLLIALIVGVRSLNMRALVGITLTITFGLIILGAYVRLSDAGLGCPDWPGCYGQLSPLQAQSQIDQATQAEPSGPVSMPKAWKEMIHRYIASLVGALIVAILIKTGLQRKRQAWHPAAPRVKIALPILLLAVVLVQGLFGKWTVTLLLKPAIVTGHLLGGMTLLALLTWFYQQLRDHALGAQVQAIIQLRVWAIVGLIALIAQIALGGWVSTNYAAAVCGELPTCQQAWLPTMDFTHGFQVMRELGKTAAGDHLSLAALTAIHFTHRLFAILVLLIVGGLAWRARQLIALHALGTGILLALAAQITLGLSVVYSMSNTHLHLVWQLPLAAAHNAGAALLLVLLVSLNYKCYAASRE